MADAACATLTDGSLMLGDIAPGRLARDSAIAKMISSFSEEMFLIVFRYGIAVLPLKDYPRGGIFPPSTARLGYSGNPETSHVCFSVFPT